LAVAAFVNIGGGGEGDSFRVTFDRRRVGEAGWATALAARCFGIRDAGDTISTNTRGSGETFDAVDETFSDRLLFFIFLLGKISSSSDWLSSRSLEETPLCGFEWTMAERLV
jgi:hypothetical protein